ncbi:MAG TPA: aminotransferase class I/II-fold pyridoxal phosphate-dependent enzyme [Candidatus Mediterraneibacter norfolkensis]|nr:aminotransferase class I/II-fold pyridoxal phosphate-dependent enzyme [Candidatus Mediterraneibacter norfolkensis]
MQAIILAAGMGKRLKELTRNNTKCMVKVNGITMIERMLGQLEKHHLSRIVIVIGYEGQKLVDFIGTLGIQTPVVYVNNPIYDRTNNIYSLTLAKRYLTQEDTILLESDIIFEDSVLDILMQDERDTLALVDKYESWMDGTCIKIDENDNIISFVPGKNFDFREKDSYYKTVNIYKFSRHFSETHYVPFLEAYSSALGNNEYYEQVLRVIAVLDNPGIKAKRLDGQCWYEIDDIQDLDIAESMFAADDNKKARLLQRRFGGYWRYPQLIDFCYLVNPYFPPKRLLEEMKSSFECLISQYPSGMRVNSLLAAKNFNVHQENIVIGNGAAELIKSLMLNISGKTGFVNPTFAEYPNRYKKEDSVMFTPDNADFHYGIKDLTTFFADKQIENLVVVNPDNPSGNYISKADLIELTGWAGERGVRLIIDESFADFAVESDNSLIDQKILKDNPHLYVIKSISKSYGVPGLRLGVLTSGDRNMIEIIKKDLPIWNINSFAEFYMQIAEKYTRDYVCALELLRKERERFWNELKKIRGIRPIPSQANYIMLEITGEHTSQYITKKLIQKYNLFVKDISEKVGGRNYLRVAVRDTEDNDILLKALRELMDN